MSLKEWLNKQRVRVTLVSVFIIMIRYVYDKGMLLWLKH